MTPLIAAAQTVHVARSAKDAPSLLSIVLRQIEDADAESTVALGEQYAKLNMNSSKRRKHFKEKTNDKSTETYDQNFVYTFGFWQDLFDPSDYAAHLPFGTFDLTRYLDGQPMSINAQVGTHVDDPVILWDIKMWHEKLLPRMHLAEADGRLRITDGI